VILVLVTASSLAFAMLVGDALSMHGTGRAVAAIATASSIVGVWIGLRLRTLQLENARLDSALDLFFGSRANSRVSILLRVVAVAALAYGLMLLSALADWDFVLLEAGVLVVWCCSFGVIYRATSRQRPVSDAVVAATCLSPLVVAFVIQQGPPLVAVGPAPVDRTARYAIYNPSFRVVSKLLRDSRTTIPSFDRYLAANTGLTDVHVDPVDIDFVPKLGPTAAPKPHIFLFVIDSLRPDYLSPYNPQVRFTPRIAEFAAESIVFRNAFTRFGGTGLSVPAMWAGASIVHKQYVQPFHPMNALEKLLDANGYRKILGLDSIMSQLLVRSEAIDELDRGRTNMDFEICRTLDELDSKLRSVGDSTPIFAYSLPQDIHMSRLPRTVEHGEEYRSFYAPYATKVHAFDACLGRFVDGLKRRGQYDRSLIVVTADHGEMLGEDGRFGHSYHLFPQVVQVPLIIHFPTSIADAAAVDADAVSLTTDITPTIYAALGYKPVQANDLMGRPLIGADDRVSTARRRDTYVIAASYGAVYAVLRHNGRRLYIADAIKGGDQAYERDRMGRWRDVGIAEGLRVVNQFAIRQYVDKIARIYGIAAR
jgi:sulfatase-like protein